MPPPPGIAGLSFFGNSATIASVVIKRPAISSPTMGAFPPWRKVDDQITCSKRNCLIKSITSLSTLPEGNVGVTTSSSKTNIYQFF